MTRPELVELAARAAAARGMPAPPEERAEAFLRDVAVGLVGEPSVEAVAYNDEPVCRICGCTDEEACPGGCMWVADPAHMGDLCSVCQPFVLERVGVGAA